jgi:hypothetical protein
VPVVLAAEREADDNLWCSATLLLDSRGRRRRSPAWTAEHLPTDDKGKGHTLRMLGEGTSGSGRRTTSTKDGRTTLSSSFSSVSAHHSSLERPKEAEAECKGAIVRDRRRGADEEPEGMARAPRGEGIADLDAATPGWEGLPMALKPGEGVPPMAPAAEDGRTGVVEGKDEVTEKGGRARRRGHPCCQGGPRRPTRRRPTWRGSGGGATKDSDRRAELDLLAQAEIGGETGMNGCGLRWGSRI